MTWEAGKDRTGWTLPLHSLPRGFLKLLEDPPDPPVRPRPSATLALIREGGDGLEVLLLKRSPRAGFIPGAWVFPGGTVDDADGDRNLLPLVHGMTPMAAAEAFGVGAQDPASPPPPAIAYWTAAVRETFEETGILLYRGEDPGGDAAANARAKLLNGELGLDVALESLGVKLDAGALTYVGHWLTPECEPRRYETRFFVAAVPRETQAYPHEKEMVDALWMSPAEALDRNRGGSFRLVLPTLFTLEQLRPFHTPDAALKRLKNQSVPRRLPVPERTDEGVLFRLSE